MRKKNLPILYRKNFIFPFEKFIARLDYLSQERKYNISNSCISAYPVLEIAAAGLFILIKSVAKKKLGIEIKTEEDIALVSSRVSRLIDVGLCLSLDSPEAAADDFFAESVLNLNLENNMAYSAFISSVSSNSAKFFAKIFKNAQEKAGQIRWYFDKICKNKKFAFNRTIKSQSIATAKIFDKYEIYWSDVIDFLSLEKEFELSGRTGYLYEKYYIYLFQILPSVLKKAKKLYKKYGGIND